METITQTKGPFNVQVRIPDSLKSELVRVAGYLGKRQKDLVTEGLEMILPIKRKEAQRLLQAEATKANGKKR
jgi:hypothetical protein